MEWIAEIVFDTFIYIFLFLDTWGHYYKYPYFTGEEMGTKRFNHLPKISELVYDKYKIQSEIFDIQHFTNGLWKVSLKSALWLFIIPQSTLLW